MKAQEIVPTVNEPNSRPFQTAIASVVRKTYKNSLSLRPVKSVSKYRLARPRPVMNTGLKIETND